MRKIGNIVGLNKVKMSEFFNINTNIDKNLPILYVGMENGKKNIENFSLLKYEYGDNVFWTFSKREKRDIFVENVDKFISFCFKNYVDNIKYEYVNFICYGYNKIKKLLKYLKSKDLKYIFYTKESRFVFIYSPKYSIVWGISISLCEYIGINKSKIMSIINRNKCNVMTNNIMEKYDIKDIMRMLPDDTHCIPIIYYMLEY